MLYLRGALLTMAVALGQPALSQQDHVQNVMENVNDFSRFLLLDQIYGELVHSDESEMYKTSRLNRNEVQLPQNPNMPPQISYEELLQSPHRILQLFEEIRKTQAKKSRLKAHSAYLRLRGKVNFPPNDSTEDLSHGTNLFGGILTFAGYPTMDCFDPGVYSHPIDIAIVGAPFDTGTSYRPGARFGPEAIRLSARRLGQGVTPVRGNGPGLRLGDVNPYDPSTHNLTIVDCGDIPMTPFDNRVALNQLYRGQRAIHNHTTSGARLIPYPKVLTMGGDHTVTLMNLRSAYEKYGQLAVLHFDSHIDTWDPLLLGGGLTDYMSLNHGTFLHYAAENGYLNPDKCFHLGLRAPYIDANFDRKHDKQCGFRTITARDLDRLGMAKILHTLHDTLKGVPVYISVDIDVLDPAFAPGTGTMEAGGWSTRELLSILDGLEGLDIVGADVVEVSPPYDTNSEVTSLAATAVMDSILGLFVVKTLE